MTLVLTGTIATFDEDGRTLEDGAIYINEGVIDAVQPRRAAAPAGFARARAVAVGGNIYPGLIDLHNHLAYNTLPLWKAPRSTPYTSRHQWPGAATYGRDISNPAQAMGIAAAAPALRYAEVRAVVGGVTSIQGSPPLTRAYAGWMVRNVEKEEFAVPAGQLIFQAVIKAEVDKLRGYGAHLADGHSFVYHLAEGTAPALNREFDDLKTAGCIHPQLIGIHCTALGKEQFTDWGATPGTVVWSPFSNIWLYGDTTDVMEARRQGLLVCLGSDWGPSGTRNLLGELKVAALWNDTSLGGALSARELCEMVTSNPGEALRRAWHHDVGRLRAGALADIMVTSKRDPDIHRSLVQSTERHVRLVVVGGRPVYGNRALLKAAGATHLETIRVAGVSKAIVMKLPDELQPGNPALVDEANLSWDDGMAAMQAVVEDPAAAVRAVRSAPKPRGAPEPLQFSPDMPEADNDGARELTDDELVGLVIPPIEPLHHDATWFARVKDGHPHAAVLRGLRDYFPR